MFVAVLVAAFFEAIYLSASIILEMSWAVTSPASVRTLAGPIAVDSMASLMTSLMPQKLRHQREIP